MVDNEATFWIAAVPAIIVLAYLAFFLTLGRVLKKRRIQEEEDRRLIEHGALERVRLTQVQRTTTSIGDNPVCVLSVEPLTNGSRSRQIEQVVDLIHLGRLVPGAELAIRVSESGDRALVDWAR